MAARDFPGFDGAYDSLPCPFCPKSYRSPDTVIKHCQRDHGAWLRTSEDVYGNNCPSCGEWFVRLDQHASKTHHRQIAILFAEAFEAGDPHGVVEARLRRYREKRRDAAIQLLEDETPEITRDQRDRLLALLQLVHSADAE